MFNLSKRHAITLLAAMMVCSLTSNVVFAARKARKDYDHRTFYADGKIVYGKISDSYRSDLSMYMVGNQDAAVKDIIDAFQKHNPGIKKIFVETIKPSQIVDGQLIRQGYVSGHKISMTPDLFATDNIDQLNLLHQRQLMSHYIIYTHNKLALEVLKGNPKHIKGPLDLARKDVVVALPNPLTEGIFKFYGAKMLKMLGIYNKVTHNAKCLYCWAIKNKTLFTAHHHYEIPHLLLTGKADVGLVWNTEIVYQRNAGNNIAGIAIPAPYNMTNKAAYAIGILNNTKHQKNAKRFLKFLSTRQAQAIYVKNGFTKATKKQLKLKRLPARI